jgi:DNA-binding NarL/FixJ family response regulator
MNGPIRLLIADDHEVVRRGLVLVLRQESGIQVIGEACDGQEAVSMAIELAPDVVLLDWKMPRLDGLQAAREIRLHAATSRVLMLSGAPLDARVLDTLDEGIDGFVHKDVSPADLAHAIRVIAAGKPYLGPEITQALIEQSRSGKGGRAPERPSLSGREQEVLELMATPATYKQIGEQLHISEETVRTYAKRILAKLEQPNRTQAVIAALRLDLIKIE